MSPSRNAALVYVPAGWHRELTSSRNEDASNESPWRRRNRQSWWEETGAGGRVWWRELADISKQDYSFRSCIWSSAIQCRIARWQTRCDRVSSGITILLQLILPFDIVSDCHGTASDKTIDPCCLIGWHARPACRSFHGKRAEKCFFYSATDY